MIKRLFFAVSGFLAIAVMVGAGFAHDSPAAGGSESAPIQRRHSGLDAAGLAVNRQSAAATERVSLPPQTNLALLQQAKRIGPHAPDAHIRLTVGMKLRNVAKLKDFLGQVQNPRSSVYRQFLTPAQFTAEYGPTKAQVAQVVEYLEGRGIRVNGVSPNRLLIRTEAPAAVYAAAFDVRIGDYELDGRRFFSTEDRPRLPRVIAGMVANIIGLNNAVRMRPMSHFKPLPEGVSEALDAAPHAPAPPPATNRYYNPMQIATAYDWPSIGNEDNGAGVTIAILTAESSAIGSNADYRNFWSAYDLPDHTVNVIPVDGDLGSNGGMGETLLDVEWSGAMAPGATLDVYVASNTGMATFVDLYNQFVVDNNAQVMTTSWGAPETAGIARTANAIFMQAAAQGISMFAAAGDYGSGDGTGTWNMADFPSVSPYITAANGTELKADKEGHYISETAWRDSGGAISEIFAQPDWQVGPGVPQNGWRNNSDVAMNAGGSFPYMLFVGGKWVLGYGTSAVAPQLAALFAIGVSKQPDGVSLGQSSSLIYDDVNANDSNYGTDFRDVTTGTNGGYQAGPGWDHPTGWGSPRGESLLSHLGIHGPAGVLEGTVTGADTGDPLAGALITINPGDYERQTGSHGTYRIALPVGSYTISVEPPFGYLADSASADIADGGDVTRDFSLQAAPKATLSGIVTDGSGHGYGLYADVRITTPGFGLVADVWTDPTTGKYSVVLSKGFKYTLTVTPAFNGYAALAPVTLTLDGDTTKDFAFVVGAACVAPGYVFRGFSQDFNGGKFPPVGWSVTNDVSGSPVVWEANSFWGNGNWTGGTGTAADVNSQAAYPYMQDHDSSLITPAITIADLPTLTLNYRANYQNSGYGADALDLDISVDGGPWGNLLHWTDNHGGYQALPGEFVSLDLAAAVPDGAKTFRLRWRNADLAVSWYDGYAQVDDVAIGACEPAAGGIVFGQVTDANTGVGVTHVGIADDKGNRVNTIANPADPDFPIGGYLMFVPSGKRMLTASKNEYTPTEKSVAMTNDAIITRNFVLKAGQLMATPEGFTLHVMVNNKKQKVLKLDNAGTGAAHYRIVSIDAPPLITTAAGAGAPPRLTEGHFSPGSLLGTTRPGAMLRESGNIPHEAPWRDITDYPIAISGNTAVWAPGTGRVYSIGGFYNGVTDAGYVYDPRLYGWNAIANLLRPRGKPAAVFINGKIYVANGWNTYGAPTSELGIYDPATDSWSAGADNPVPAGGGSVAAVLNGKMYIIGGCDDRECDKTLSAVQVYDPATDTWSSAADYPVPVSWEACGTIAGKLYCAGGDMGRGTTTYKTGYAYDPKADEWTSIADMPIDLWGMAYTAANGKLLVSGGVTDGGAAITNQGFAYDPASDSWSPLPNSNYTTYRGASACGFYKIGGLDKAGSASWHSEVLPGYELCGLTGIAWLTVTPPTGTVAAGAPTTIGLDFDGTGQAEYTTSKAYLKVTGTPYEDGIVPLTVTWDPQPVRLQLAGSANKDAVRKGDAVVYTISVANARADNHGAATATLLTYAMPKSASYVASSGDASCTAPSAGSAPAPAAATGGNVICDLGTVAEGASKTVTIAIEAEQAGTLAGHFAVTAREPDDSDRSTLDIETTVIGIADVNVSTAAATIPEGGRGTLRFVVSDAGPDPATGVRFQSSSGGNAKLMAAKSSQGSCTVSGSGAYSCDIGEIEAGGKVQITLTAFGLAAGTATVQGQVFTSSDDPDQINDIATAMATVKAADNGGGNNGGGGALGWMMLVGLLGVALAGVCRNLRRRMG